MLNLSDKELDRLSQEAAQQHEPGDIVGPRFWEKLEARLDRDLGKVTPNPARGIHRLPYYYAPALLVILGVTYYLVRPGGKFHKVMSSGSPPLSITQQAPANPLKPVRSSSNPVLSDNSNSTPSAPSSTIQYPGTADAHPTAPAGSSNAPVASSSAPAASSNAPAASSGAPAASSNAPAGSSDAPAASARLGENRASTSSTKPQTSTNFRSSVNRRRRHNHPANPKSNKSSVLALNDGKAGSSYTDITSGMPASVNPTGTPGSANPAGTPGSAINANTATRSPGDLAFSAVRGPIRLAHVGRIDDSALRAFNLANLRQPIHDKGGLHINRSLVFGITGGPDYASVNSLSGDRPGSTIGATIDYQFLNHLYIGTGLLFARRIFAAFPQDYHVPDNYYRTTGLGMGGGVEYIKGAFTMLEVPLNLRWDFNTSDNSLFYIGIGTSSYFFDRQNCGYYYSFYNPRNPRFSEITYDNQPSTLFASVNFSAGAEFGLTNSLSFLVGGYLKSPTRGIGFGQVDMTSFGLTFGLHYAPVISRKRR